MSNFGTLVNILLVKHLLKFRGYEVKNNVIRISFLSFSLFVMLAQDWFFSLFKNNVCMEKDNHDPEFVAKKTYGQHVREPMVSINMASSTRPLTQHWIFIICLP